MEQVPLPQMFVADKQTTKTDRVILKRLVYNKYTKIYICVIKQNYGKFMTSKIYDIQNVTCSWGRLCV